jgi:hypothetical protein
MHTLLRPPVGGALALLFAFLIISGCASSSTTADETAAAADTTAADTTGADTTLAVVPREIPRTIPRLTQRQETTAGLDTVRAGRFDQGKMWTFEHPPVEYFSETYDFNPDEEWFEHARLGTLRIPGCSASFVSPSGLVLTNHHCGRDHATSVSREGESILDDGFYAENLDDERRVDGLWADQLVEIRDVTSEVDEAVAGAQTDAERAQARQEAMQQIEQRISGEMGADYLAQVISLYDGGVFSAYIFRRYTDVRLVMAPELQVGFFGGDPDNFTYPRYTLDMTLFRIYGDDGAPLRSDTYFRWTEDGVEDGDAVFVIGNPGSTFRLSTVSQFEFRRDVEEGAVLNLVSSRVDALQQFLDASNADTLDELRNEIFSLLNARKLYRGTVSAANDPVILARRMDAERKFREAIGADPALQEQYGGLIEQMDAIQEQRREYAAELRSFLALAPQSTLGAATMRRAVVVYRHLAQREQGATGEEPLQQALAQIEMIQDQPRSVQEAYLTLRINDFQNYFGEDSEIVRDLLDGRSPEQAADQILDQSVLTTAESAEQALRQGTVTMDDAAVQAAASFVPRLNEFSSAMAGLVGQENEIASRLGRARFAVYGTDVPPDATFSLRIADGIVAGYPYNGTVAPPYTVIFGAYDLYHAHGADTPWDLPESWVPPPPDFDLQTPLNFVSTNDIIGGNSGSPVVNTDLELVGLVFDGNIESLSADFIYLTDRARAVNVDARGIKEALDDVYGADRIVLELSTGELVESEAEADAMNTNSSGTNSDSSGTNSDSSQGTNSGANQGPN